MKLKQLGTNQTVINYNDGTEVFFSYETPVAGYHPDLGYVRTKEWYSSTTTRHINKYLAANNNNLDNHFSSVSQEIINSLANGCYEITEYTDAEKELTTLEELSNDSYNPERSMTDSRYAQV